MARASIHRLLTGPAPAPDRIFFHGPWSSGHKNPRYARLVPRLPRLDAYLIEMSEQRVLRAVQYRAWRRLRGPRHRLLVGAGSRRYRYMLTTDPEQIPYFSGRVVVDVDEPRFEPWEVEAMNRPNVEAIVVSNDRTAGRLREIGIDKPFVSLPGGVDVSRLKQDDVAEVARRHRRNGELIVGHISAWFLTKSDRTYDWTNDLEHVLELWDGVRAGVPGARLWLIGQASPSARAACAGREDVDLFDDIPYGGALPYIANFDVGLYPRTGPDYGIPVKLFEYMGTGVPIVAYDLGSTKIVRQKNAGVTARDARGFVDAVCHLAVDADARQRYGAAGRKAGAELDWDAVIRRYEREVLDRYLPA